MNARSMTGAICCLLLTASAAPSSALAQVEIREPTQVIEAPPDPEPGPEPTAYLASGIAKHNNTLLLTPASAISGYIYTRESKHAPWTYDAKLRLPDGVGGTYDVAVEGDTAVITGAFSLDLARVYVFRRTAGVWRHVQTISEQWPQPPDVGGTFGYRIALSAGTLAIANFLAEGSKGVVYIYKRGKAGRFQLRQRVVGEVEGGGLGFDLALHRNTMLASNSDRVLVYQERATGWKHQDTLWPPTQPAPYSFGTDLALNGKTAVVSSPWGDVEYEPYHKTGAIYVYRRSAGGWTFDAKLVEPFAYEGSFGEFVAVQGNKIATNAWGREPGATDRILIFERQNGAWTPSEMLVAPRSDFGYGYELHWSGKDLFTTASSMPTDDPLFEGQVFHYRIPPRGDGD